VEISHHWTFWLWWKKEHKYYNTLCKFYPSDRAKGSRGAEGWNAYTPVIYLNEARCLNKLPGYKRSTPLLLSSLLRDRTGKIYTVCCNTYALSFVFARMFNDDLSPRRTTSVLASCTFQSAILLRTAQSIQQYGSTEWNWLDPDRDLREFVVIFEILPIDNEWKSDEITYCRSWTSCGFNDRNATLQVDFFTHRQHSNANSSTVFCFTEQNSNSVSFSQSQCCSTVN